MIIKKISLNNIRSYENQEVEFNKGSTLLWGDIGSGKTSILMAIEFALFGLQPGQRGSSLLKNSAVEGGVSIEFEIGGKEIFIERELKRGSNTISQGKASISIDEEKQELSVTELKSKVLEILNYPKEFSKKQNLLYKFTVYTPQEEMKQIILQDPKTRINTLRHIFGIDKYKKIIENASILVSKIREEKRIKQGMTHTLDQDKLELSLKEQELKSKKEKISEVESRLLIKTQEKEKIKKELDEISDKKDEKIKLQQEVEKTKLMISNKNSLISDNYKLITQLKNQVLELNKISFDETKIGQLEKEIDSLKKLKKEIESKILETSTTITSLNFKNQENQKIKEKLTHIEVCPTCLQDVNPTYKSNVIKKMDKNTFENKAEINKQDSKKEKLFEEVKIIEEDISKKEKEIQELNVLKIKQEGVQEKNSRIKEIELSNDNLSKDADLLNKQLNLLKESVLKMQKFDSLFYEKQLQLEEARKKEKIEEIKLAELKKEIDLFSIQIENLKDKIEKIEQIKNEFNHLSDLENWLTKQFLPMMSSVEKNVMNTLKFEFSKLFSEWFSMLVPDSFEVKLDDEFTPVVEQKDYILDYAYLSGGERTAIALAYRLSLNQIINSMLSDIGTKGIIILDEPTDGFSEQQLDKMRSVLEQLEVNQLIMVSHEQKIEGFVENVIRLGKENGTSSVDS